MLWIIQRQKNQNHGREDEESQGHSRVSRIRLGTQANFGKKFFNAFLPYIALISLVCISDGAARIYHNSSLFTCPVTSIHTGACGYRHRERECLWWGNQEDKSTINLDCIQVQNLAACMAGKCFNRCVVLFCQKVQTLAPDHSIDLTPKVPGSDVITHNCYALPG